MHRGTGVRPEGRRHERVYGPALHIPDDVRILARPPHSLYQWITLVHEMGHALAYRSCRGEGIFASWTPVEDEIGAIIIEQLGVELLLDEPRKRAAADIQLLEAVRCCISMLFELDLWKDPQQAEQLYEHWYGQLTPDVGDRSLWVLDSFRSIDPVTVFAYTAGYAAGRNAVREKIRGPLLVRQLFAPGRSQPLSEKLALLLGTAWWKTC